MLGGKDIKMKKYTIMMVVLLLCVKTVTGVQAQSEDNLAINNNVGKPTIAVTKLDISDKNLKLRYEIRNMSKQDIWILDGLGRTDVSAEMFMDRDDRTLLIRNRLDVPFGGGGEIVYGRYILLRAGQTQTESITLATPVNPQYGFIDRSLRPARGLEYATCLAIEIGYYDSDLPDMILGILEKADMIKIKKSVDDQTIKLYFGGSLHFNKLNEILRQRDEEVLVPYTYQWFKGEKVLRTIVEDVRIPYEEKSEGDTIQDSLDIPYCTRVEIQYQPSMLEYFFPYTGQQNLLSQSEKEYLRSTEKTVMNDSQTLQTFIDNINKGVFVDGGVVREKSVANLVCYRDDKRLASFPIYNNNDSVVVGDRNRFKYDDGFQILRIPETKIQPLELRAQCAANLRNLWHRLRLCYKTEKKGPVDSSGKTEISYPQPANWCGAIVRACRTIEMLNEEIIRPFICPAVAESKIYLAKSYYAMNPNCEPDSPPDMVLLFETKAGWNQNGGPELFIFDNHDPKGGCVLLNDGTVKFIRKNEELQKLRWK
jgi:hypothetical protein